MAQAFVTGGSGFIGQVLVRRLVDAGLDVRALVRSDSSAERVESPGAKAVRGDVSDSTMWRHEVEDSDVFFHLAAQTDVDADRADHERVTVHGTRAALEAAVHAGVPRFVHCGTEAALLAGAPLIDVDESAPLRPDSDAAYSATKAEAEQLVLDANSTTMATVSVRPRFVWGPHSILIDGLVAAAKAGEFAWIDGGRHTTDVTYVDNAVEGLVLGWQRGTPGEAYFVTDRHRVVLREFLGQLFSIYGVDTEIPDITSAEAEQSIPVPARWFLGQTCTLRTGKAVSDLGYEPVVPHEIALDVLRESVAHS
ncbi:NAD-dependent epimerase/dehydratase family protein [Allobranchiibius huperziae]|uniref:Nucleoside-diphosphate-sugar epimerase n=1 Tax=Allobranchiibius huperziae TaxID=1874116 RepID=A0A853DIR0_9MICO|nr:NAD-dependent epimerase/dehydratase family protein [Allobranchiibius huperziae]NYJ74914.1 nucleoside-diphosphate-sugar epimerase [Allobranchiibius huperziae]